MNEETKEGKKKVCGGGGGGGDQLSPGLNH